MRHNIGKCYSVLKNIGTAGGIIGAAVLICILMSRFDAFDHTDAYTTMIFILAVFLVSHYTEGYVYGAISSILGVLAVNYFFTYPYFAFNFSLPGYGVTMICMLTVSLLTSTMTTRAKAHELEKREADREVVRGNLLRAVSHDLRTPLTSILGANSVLLEHGDELEASQRIKLRQEIDDDARWLIRMVENLLTITRIRQDGNTRIQKNPEAVEEVFAEAVSKFHKRYSSWPVTVRVPDDLLLCPMDAMLVEQVLQNLMINVVEHGEYAKHIELTAQCCKDDIVVRVLDDGCGVSAERLKHLFEDGGHTASTADDAKRNMGIGLSVCRAIIAAHGGRMNAENREGGGLAVSFTLPMKEDESVQ